MNNAPFADWALIRVFLAVAEAGSLGAAARLLGLSQPTLSRRLRALEDAFGGPLFRRHARGFELTDTGAALLPDARAMRDAAARFALSASGHETPLAGTVRISASRIMASLILPPMLCDLRAALPDCEVELHASDSTDNLLFQEADIAIRMYRPAQEALIARSVGTLPIGLFASQGYVDRRGMPDKADVGRHDWVGYDRNPAMREGMRAAGFAVDRGFFAFRSDDQVACWQMVRAGCGIGVGPLAVGLRDPGLVQVLPETDIPALPVWLVAPEALRRTARIRAVWDRLADGLRAMPDRG